MLFLVFFCDRFHFMFMSSIQVFEKHLLNLAKQQASRKGVKEEVST